MKAIFICSLLCLTSCCDGQDYHAITGSNFACSLGVLNNPASIVNTPYPWDITLFGVQSKYETNAITVIDYSLISSPANSKFLIKGGNFSRFGNEQTNLNLFNTRISLWKRKAIAFGANLRSVSNFKTDPYQYLDTIQSFQSFFSLNTSTGPLNGQLRSGNLLEIYFSYAQTFIDHPYYRLNGGLTMKLNKGLAGLQSSLRNIHHQEIQVDGETNYLVNGGDLSYGYSSTIDPWESSKSGREKLKSLLSNALNGFSFDVGMELIIKPPGVPGYMDDEESYYYYDWKFGLSIMDIGKGRYSYGENSQYGTIPSQGFTAYEMDAKFDSTVTGLSEFTDSLATMMPLNSLGGIFDVYTPARIILNVDRYLWSEWFINAELSINLSPLLGSNKFFVKDMNLFRVTPRWETRRWGLYMPVQVNSMGRFWLGAAAKVGPLLIGFHNLGNIFSKNKMANGGGFFAINIRPGELVTGEKKQKMLDCPKY